MEKNQDINKNVKCHICGLSYKESPSKNFALIQINNDKMYLCDSCIASLAEKVGILNGDFYNNINVNDMEQGWQDEIPCENDSTNNIKKNKTKSTALSFKNTSPLKIKEYLDQYIIGQDEAKKAISVAYYNHLKRITLSKNNKDMQIKKSNILLIGPTGSGKTLIAQKLALMAKVPFVVADATTFTKKGYVGEDVESILIKLYNKANGNKTLTEQGIVYFDECDKLTGKQVNGINADYVGGEGVQQSLLKMIEGNEISLHLHTDNNISERILNINTQNILFIFGGAFSGIDKIFKERINQNNQIGFLKDNKDYIKKEFDYNNLEPIDFIKYGLMPELIGRLPVIASLNKLTEKDLVKVLMEPKDSICKEYISLFKLDNIDLIFEDNALNYIAKESLKKGLGARGLRSIIEKKLKNLMFITPTNHLYKSIKITENFIKDPSLSNIDCVFNKKNSKSRVKKITISDNEKKVGAEF